MTRIFLNRAIRIFAALAVLGLVTLFYRTTELGNATTVALSFLLVVLAVATLGGLLEAILVSLFAALALNFFFLPPVGTFTIADPLNWVALFTFFVVSLVASQLSERARRKAREAIEHQQESERLYALSRSILMLGGDPAQVASEVTRKIQEVFRATTVVFFHPLSGQYYRAGPDDFRAADLRQRQDQSRAGGVQGAPLEMTVMQVTHGGVSIGSLEVWGAHLSPGAQQAVSNLVALALESARSRELATHAESVRQSEEFKSTLLDALAHELKTPLTSLKASVSALRVAPSSLAPSQLELLSIVEEETDRLNRLLSEVLHLARIEAGMLRLNRQTCPVDSLIRQALDDSRRLLEDREVRVSLPPELPPVSADPGLIQTVLRHLLDNAAKYSPPDKPILVSAEADTGLVRVRVTDQGPGLPEQELSLVFEKYYRGPNRGESVPGLGMGLAIAREIVVAHGGKVWAESPADQGAQFSFTLPVASEGQRG